MRKRKRVEGPGSLVWEGALICIIPPYNYSQGLKGDEPRRMYDIKQMKCKDIVQ